MYYLNAFNEMLRKRQRQNMMGDEMLRKRQRQNMMGGEGYQGDAAPSGPMGARQSGGGMAGVRNALTNMNPFVSAGLSMIPGVGAPLALARLANYGVSQYEKSRANQNPYADDSMDRLSFNAPSPEYGPAPVGTIYENAYEGAMATNSFPAGSMGGSGSYNYGDFGDAAMAAPTSIVGEPIRQSSFTGESLAPMAPMAGDFGGRLGGAGGGFGGGVGTGDFGGSPADAADLGYNQGGMVNAQHLMGRAPAPDDGYGALQGGEYVITKAAVEKYGKRLLDAINNGTFR